MSSHLAAKQKPIESESHTMRDTHGSTNPSTVQDMQSMVIIHNLFFVR